MVLYDDCKTNALGNLWCYMPIKRIACIGRKRYNHKTWLLTRFQVYSITTCKIMWLPHFFKKLVLYFCWNGVFSSSHERWCSMILEASLYLQYLCRICRAMRFDHACSLLYTAQNDSHVNTLPFLSEKLEAKCFYWENSLLFSKSTENYKYKKRSSYISVSETLCNTFIITV